MTLSSEVSCSFPKLLQLSPKGEGFRRSFVRGCPRAVSCPKLQLLGCEGGWRGLGAATRALPEGPTGVGGQWGCQDQWVLVLWCLEHQVSCGHSSFPSKGGTIQRQFSLGAGSRKWGQSPAPQPWQCFSGLFVYTSICHALGKELAESL